MFHLNKSKDTEAMRNLKQNAKKKRRLSEQWSWPSCNIIWLLTVIHRELGIFKPIFQSSQCCSQSNQISEWTLYGISFTSWPCPTFTFTFLLIQWCFKVHATVKLPVPMKNSFKRPPNISRISLNTWSAGLRWLIIPLK